MSDNQILKQDFINFLETVRFQENEFKDIRSMFIEAHPQFESKKFYAKIHNIVRELHEAGLIYVDKSTCTYKYTSRYSRGDLINYLMNESDSYSTQKQLPQNQVQLEEEVAKVNLKLEILLKYIRLYPLIVDKISHLATDTQSDLKNLHSEIRGLNDLVERLS